MKSRTKRKLLPILAASIAVAASLWLGWFVVMRPADVLHRGRLFCNVGPWVNQPLDPLPNHYYWLNTTTALVACESDPANSDCLYQVSLRSDGTAENPVRSICSGAVPVRSLAISPDGRSMAYFESGGTGTQNEQCNLAIRKFDGTLVLRRTLRNKPPTHDPYTDSMKLIWSPDGEFIYRVRSGADLVLERVRVKGGKIETFPVTLERKTDDMEKAVILGFTAPNRLLLASQGSWFENLPPTMKTSGSSRQDDSAPRILLAEFEVGLHSKLVKTYSPHLPANAGIGMIALSPKGDRLLWSALCVNSVPPLQAWLHRWIPSVPGEETVTERGWISDLDNKNFREIGYYNIPPSHAPTAQSNEPWIIDPKWTPDGKRIGFVYKDRLMTIPAD